jgi:hypothetical protein
VWLKIKILRVPKQFQPTTYYRTSFTNFVKILLHFGIWNMWSIWWEVMTSLLWIYCIYWWEEGVGIAWSVAARRSGVWIPETQDIYLFSTTDRVWGPPSLPFNGYWDSFPGLMRPGREVDHPHPPRTEVKNEWSCTSSRTNAFIAWTGTTLHLPFTGAKSTVKDGARLATESWNHAARR